MHKTLTKTTVYDDNGTKRFHCYRWHDVPVMDYKAIELAYEHGHYMDLDDEDRDYLREQGDNDD